MLIVCPNCASEYEVAESALGAAGRKLRCRACGAGWFQAPPTAAPPPPTRGVVPPTLAPVAVAPAAAPRAETARDEEPAPKLRGRRGPWLLLALVALVAVLGVTAAMLALGSRQVAARFGIGDAPVPLGIAIIREPDWRMIADGGQLFAVSGRVWNPTSEVQNVPDIRAELKDARGRIVYAWTITRPVAQLEPGRAVAFDGAAVDVPPTSTHVSVSFAGGGDR